MWNVAGRPWLAEELAVGDLGVGEVGIVEYGRGRGEDEPGSGW